MNKTAIKNFAIWARNKLIADITYKAGLLGITEKEIKSPLSQSTKDIQFFDIGTKEPYPITGVKIEQRGKLAEAIQQKAKQSDYKTAYKSVIEEVAYTWFNRLIAVRFMEVNDYLPTRVRVLSSESSTKLEPDLVTSPFDADLDYSAYEKDRIMQLKNNNMLDELFCMLFIKQCNALNAILPELFEKTNDYTELLMNVSFTDKDGVVYHLVHDIPEDDFTNAVEIIGWMYQYYNDERKNEVINIYKGTVKKEDIPAATQLFTTNWVVRYMVDNSLGRYWIERNPNSMLREKLDFFVMPKSGDINHIDEKVEPTELAFFDPCMGSGHILVYAFDVLMEIYKERGYPERDAAASIVQENIFGLDIDDRASQLAYFAVMMKARSYDRRFLTRGIKPNVMAIQESNAVDKFFCEGLTTDKGQNQIGEYLVSTFRHAKEIGSLLSVSAKDYESFSKYLFDCQAVGQIDLFSSEWINNTMPLMRKLAKQADIMSRKYAIVCTNPPYMNKLESNLKKFVTTQYKPYSGDLFSVFMYRNFDFCKVNGYSAFMTPFVWMFIKTYEDLREYIINDKSITTLAQMEYSSFEEATVPICTFVLKNGKANQNGYYFKLSEFKGGMEVQKNKVLGALADKNCGYFYETDAEDFSRIPGLPIAYWVSDNIISMFTESVPLERISHSFQGMITGNNGYFLRLWYEPNFKKVKLNSTNENSKKFDNIWVPYNKGGGYRKWYGNNEYILRWVANGTTLTRARNENESYYFRKGVTWSFLTSGNFSCRYFEEGFLWDVAGSSIFASKKEGIEYICALMNCKISQLVFNVINPTLNFQVMNIIALPYFKHEKNNAIAYLSKKCIHLSKYDWDSFETSWNFKTHPLLSGASLKIAFEKWQEECDRGFIQLKANEEELNRIFIDIYGLQDELTPEVDDKDVTVARIYDSKEDIPESMKGNNYVLTKSDVIKSFISYAVGCMFGRYSLDVDGLAYAGGEWDDSKYSTFIPDKDNILPITDEEYLEDDVVGLFCAFLKKTYGVETLEENLDFIAKALGNRGNSSREIIRNYFLKDFFKDHCKIYKKRPIYWLFDSGRANGFKALIYLHRYNADTIGNLRIDYLHRMQRVYESEIARMQETIDNSNNGREVTAATKRKEKLLKQLKETKEYDEKIAHLALARIDIDLDDGVKVNYEKVQTGTDGKKLDVLAKI